MFGSAIIGSSASAMSQSVGVSIVAPRKINKHATIEKSGSHRLLVKNPNDRLALKLLPRVACFQIALVR